MKIVRIALVIVGVALMIGAPGSADQGRLSVIPAALLTLTGCGMVLAGMKMKGRDEK